MNACFVFGRRAWFVGLKILRIFEQTGDKRIECVNNGLFFKKMGGQLLEQEMDVFGPWKGLV